MFGLITGLYRAMEQGAVLAFIAERHGNDPATMAGAIDAVFSPRETLVEAVTLIPATEVEELAAA